LKRDKKSTTKDQTKSPPSEKTNGVPSISAPPVLSAPVISNEAPAESSYKSSGPTIEPPSLFTPPMLPNVIPSAQLLPPPPLVTPPMLSNPGETTSGSALTISRSVSPPLPPPVPRNFTQESTTSEYNYSSDVSSAAEVDFPPPPVEEAPTELPHKAGNHYEEPSSISPKESSKPFVSITYMTNLI
jgi:hypothetical protein